MPALDRYHDAVAHALEKDGWTITADPLLLRYADAKLYVDLAADQVVAAEKGARKIAVEIKTFTGASEMKDLHNAVGQFIVYRNVLQALEPDRDLYLAVPDAAWQEVFQEGIGALVLRNEVRRLVVFDVEREEVIRWEP